MQTADFYNLIDSELDEILAKFKDDDYIRKNKNSINNQKAYAFLIWFLNFYGKKTEYLNYITDGNDDSTCDIIFDNVDNYGQRVFYIVQSKWNILKNADKEIEKKDILQALSDFDTLIRGNKKNINEKLKAKIESLQEHQKANGEVKFIYLALCNNNPKSADNVESFLSVHKRTRFEFYDINRIKGDYIERKFKLINPVNPLENYYNPEETKITLEVQKARAASGNFIRVEKPFEAYVFLIKPKIIFELFEKYGFALFFRNVRNPLIESEFNKEIVQTAIDNPAYFWYYNNGITAITYLMPEIRDEATLIELTGLQIINGAQTVYSIYRAYRDASITKRSIIDSEALISLRLLKSGGRDFDLKVTKFTNSQNPVNDRDFIANDDVQIRLQNESFKTNFWFEKRRGEFREIPKRVRKIPNQVFANCYLAYQLGDPVSVLQNFRQSKQSKKDLVFVSRKDNKDGLYESIFNADSNFDDFLTAFYILDVIMQHTPLKFKDSFTSNIYHMLALFKIVFTKYAVAKRGNDIDVDLYIRRLYREGGTTIIVQTFKYISVFLENEFKLNDGEKSFDRFISFLTSSTQFERIRGELEESGIKIETIENMEKGDFQSIIEIHEENEGQFMVD